MWHSSWFRGSVGFFVFSFTACGGNSDGRVDTVPPPALADSDSRVITSVLTARDYQVTVALPRGYNDSDDLYPVLYAVDANGQLGIVVETARLMRFDELLPELIIIGIGYPVGRMWDAQSPRLMDLTPTSDLGKR